MTKQIELDHVGPIAHLTIPIPEAGGIVVLRGANGSGKTHALSGVEAMYSTAARKQLRPSDGVPSGRIEGLGVTVRLGRSNTIRGELVCESLDGRLDPSMLVDPGLKDADAADSRRLATLIRLSGVQVDAARWREIVGESYSDEIGIDALLDPDPVVAADRIRRRLHDLALTRERLAASKDAEAASRRKAVADVSLDSESDERSLQSRLTESTAALMAARQQAERAEWAAVKVADLRAKVAAARKGPDIEEIFARAENARAAQEAAERGVRHAAAALEAARQTLTQTQAECEMASAGARWATDQDQLIRAWSSTIEELAAISAPEPGEVAALDMQHAEAVRAAQGGAVVRRAQAEIRIAEALASEAQQVSLTAAWLRETARSTDQVLEQALVDAGFGAVKVHDGRLCVESDRGLEPFSDLSHGERWRFALDLAARGLPKGSVLPVRQEAFESLDPANRAFVHRLAMDRGLVILTAEATAGQLRAEVWHESEG